MIYRYTVLLWKYINPIPENTCSVWLTLWVRNCNARNIIQIMKDNQNNVLGTSSVEYCGRTLETKTRFRVFSLQKRTLISKEALSGLPKKSSFLSFFCHHRKCLSLVLYCSLSCAASDRWMSQKIPPQCVLQVPPHPRPVQTVENPSEELIWK